MVIIYKSCSPKYTHEQIENLGVKTTCFVSFERLLKTSINEAIGKKQNEKIIGMGITGDGINIYIETED